MPSAELSRRVEKVVCYPPLSEMGDLQRREFHEALLDAASFEHLPRTSGPRHLAHSVCASMVWAERRAVASLTPGPLRVSSKFCRRLPVRQT